MQRKNEKKNTKRINAMHTNAYTAFIQCTESTKEAHQSGNGMHFNEMNGIKKQKIVYYCANKMNLILSIQ